MDAQALRKLLQSVKAGETDVEAALTSLRVLPYRDLDFAKVDHHRALRCGFPEVIFCPGKRPEDVAAIAREILDSGCDLLATRASEEAHAAVAAVVEDAVWHARARCITVRRSEPSPDKSQSVAIVCAGTSDLPVADEAAITAEMAAIHVRRFNDVGVAGLHRLLEHTEALREARAIVVVAGMEGALPSVVAGLVDRPVIAVPTSVGYGASFGGVAALLAMLNSCANGIAVVNIDNGFGAGYMASLIARAGQDAPPEQIA